MKITKLAAIDIGSNAVRMLINSIYDEGKHITYNKTSLVRVPIRLGQDSFSTGTISDDNLQRFKDSMKAFKLLMSIHKVDGYMAYATSAMRELKDSKKIVKDVKKSCGIDIEIIDGKKEGRIIFATELKAFVNDDNNYLYVDVGGGSTECTLLANGKVLDTRSFEIGTVRWLNGRVGQDYLEKEVKPWIIENCGNWKNIQMIGSGGNINHIFKQSGQKSGKPIDYRYINRERKILTALSFEDRLQLYNMKEDRADVIVPALNIYTSIMRYAKINKCLVPKIGLADGMIQYHYLNDYRS